MSSLGRFSGLPEAIENLACCHASFPMPIPGCIKVRQRDARMTITPSKTMNCVSLFAGFPEKPSLSSTDRKTVRTKRHEVARRIAGVVSETSSLHFIRIEIRTCKEYLEFLAVVEICVVGVEFVGVSLDSDEEIDAADREGEQTCNLERQSGHQNVRSEINLCTS